MIAPLNYAAQAVKELKELLNHPRVLDKSSLRTMVNVIEGAMHFQLPDGGRILQDGLKGLRDETLRLPYVAITVEYRVPPEMHRLTDKTPKMCFKRMALATGIEKDQLDNLILAVPEPDKWRFADGAINVVVIDFIEGRWIPLEVGCVLPSHWWFGEYETGEPKISGYPYTLLPEMFDQSLKAGKSLGYSEEQVRNDMAMDTWDEVCSVLALLEALSCSNVKAESIQTENTSLNARRAKDGKLPLYEVKVLTIDAPRQLGERRSFGGHHASPRQHLRRGHIRHRNDKKFWVNSHLVGDPAKGKIVKSYDVRRGT